MTVRLRAHHLLCMLTYVGRGYSPAFTANYDAIAARLSAGEAIEVVSGPDDICAPLLLDAEPHCHEPRVLDRDAVAAEAVASRLGMPVAAGETIVLDAAMLAALRQGFRTGGARAACAACDWFDLCTKIADDGFAGARVAIDAP